MDYDWSDAVLHYIFRSTQKDAWFKPSQENISAGVCLRIAPGQFRTFPYENPYLAPFEAAVTLLNPLVAVKIRSAAVHSALATIPKDSAAIYIDANTRIQILDTVTDLPKADKEQSSAFLRDERVLVVWSDELEQIAPLCREIEVKIMKLVWSVRPQTMGSFMGSFSGSGSARGSVISGGGSISGSNFNVNLVGGGLGTGSADGNTENTSSNSPGFVNASGPPQAAQGSTIPPQKQEVKEPAKQEDKGGGWWKIGRKKQPEGVVVNPNEKGGDVEKGIQPRYARLFAPLYGGLAMGLSIFFAASGLSILLQEWQLDQDYMRFALLAASPFLLCVSIFFANQVVINISFVVGPVAQYYENSKFYSGVKPDPNPEVDSQLPHITIEMPVYKESLEETIAPSVSSLKKAMQTYARQGGTSSVFIHDDGLQLLNEEERQKRIEYYADHNIGWVARPPHDNENADGFKRAGRFKKASNMNYGLQLSMVMEKHIIALENSGDRNPEGDYNCLEDRALAMAIEEVNNVSGGNYGPWANNGRALRIGDIILLVDSDTVVPEDCLRDAARELAECPEVGIIQHESDVNQVAHHYFENGITHFTRRINKCISMGCANGEVAPFVGHNAFLRWSALQEAAFVDTSGTLKVWSEENVSEDFDMALRLQLKGYVIRWATYSEGGFKEGVSLTIDDELNRWQKYAYGCNELIFNPLVSWWRLGPINKQLRQFLWSGAPIHYKINMLSYMFSYYGIAAAFLVSIINYILLGFELPTDGYFMHSFEVWMAVTVVFPGAGNIAYTILEYRLGHRDIFSSFFENFLWVPFFFFFFNGLSIHLSAALLAHLFSYNITWGATKKEVERSNFWREVPKIVKRFWFAFLLSFICIIGMIILTTPLVPVEWRVPGHTWSVILPLALTAGGHILFPIVLNPWLMIFSY